MGDYRVQDLARLGGTTVRNIRAYRERGLLAPPHLSGRTGWYDDTHLARLRLITGLLDRGYTLANIAELLAAWEGRRPIPEVLGIEQALTRPLSTEEPWSATPAEVAARAGLLPEQMPFGELANLGLVELDVEHGTVVVTLPSLLDCLAGLVRLGLPVAVAVTLTRTVVGALDQLSQQLVGTVGETLYPPRAEPVPVPEFEADLGVLLGIAAQAVTTVFGWSLERQVAGEFGRTVERRMNEAQVVG